MVTVVLNGRNDLNLDDGTIKGELGRFGQITIVFAGPLYQCFKSTMTLCDNNNNINTFTILL